VVPSHSHRAFVTGSGELTLTIGTKICRECGFVFLSPRMDKEESNIYCEQQSRYVKCFKELKQSGYADLVKDQIDLISKWCPNAFSRVLEIGSAEGYFLHILSLEKDVEVEGVEPSIAYQEYCSKHFPKVKMHWATLESIEFPEAHFSLCVMRHVLEHLESPIESLKSVHKLLRNKDGYLYIEVPNLSRAQAAIYDYFHEQHLSYFTSQTIKCICESAGFICRLIDEWDDNAEASGFNYPVLRVIAQKSTNITQRTVFSSNYNSSKYAIENYFRLKESFLERYIRPLENKIVSWLKAGKRIALFGGGPHTAVLLQELSIPESTFNIIFDNDCLKWGKEIRGIRIVSPQEALNYKPDIVVISSREFENEIAEDLVPWADMGIRAERIYN
jgi:SAM-dependent methyltransferase